VVDEDLRRRRDQSLRHRRGGGEERPHPEAEAEVGVREPVRVAGRHDVENREAGDDGRVVECHPVRAPRAPVVADHGEPVVSQRAHHLHLLGGEDAHGVRRVVRRAQRRGAGAVAAQVGGHDGVSLGEDRCDPVPHEVRLRDAVQQQDGRAGPAAAAVDAGDVDPLEARVHGHHLDKAGGRE